MIDAESTLITRLAFRLASSRGRDYQRRLAVLARKHHLNGTDAHKLRSAVAMLKGGAS